MSTPPRLLLASASPRRRELLTLIGLPFETTEADIDETALRGEPPLALVVRLSEAKAAIAGQTARSKGDQSEDEGARRQSRIELQVECSPGKVILACDTIVVLRGDVLGKPGSPDDARWMLGRLRALEHDVFTAISLLDLDGGWRRTEVARTNLTMRAYSDAEIAAYVASGDPLDKAGAYAIQHAGFHPVSSFQGCYANVVGLPLCHLARCLREVGLELPPGLPDRCQAHTRQVCTVFQDIFGKI